MRDPRSPSSFSWVSVVTSVPGHDALALIPNKLLPTTERPQPVSSAACASNILGETPSLRLASTKAGRSCRAKDRTWPDGADDRGEASLVSEADRIEPFVGSGALPGRAAADWPATDVAFRPASPRFGEPESLFLATAANGRKPLLCQ